MGLYLHMLKAPGSFLERLFVHTGFLFLPSPFSHCLLPFSYHESCSAVQPLNQYLGTEAIESSNDILGRQSREGH